MFFTQNYCSAVAMNMALKVAILQSGKTQREIAEEIGLSEGYLSRFVRGWEQPNPDQQKAIAKALKAKPAELFAEAS